MKFKSKVRTCDAMQLTDKNRDEVLKWLTDVDKEIVVQKAWDPVNVYVRTVAEPVNGQVLTPGDYLVRDGNNFRLVRRADFEAVWEKAGVV